MKPMKTMLIISALMAMSEPLCAAESPDAAAPKKSTNPSSNRFWGKKKATIGLGLTGAASIAAWALAQHALSITPHKRYRLKKRLAALGDAIAKEKDAERNELMHQEQIITKRQLAALSKERLNLKVVRTLLALLALATTGGALFSYTQRSQEKA